MMRTAVMVLAATALAALLPATARAQATTQLKIAYVDSDELIQSAPGYEQAKQAFEQTAGAWEDTLRQRQARLQQMYDEYKKQEVILSPEKKTERQQELLTFERESQQYFQTKFGPQGESSSKQAELMRPIIERVNAAIEQVRREGNYSLIFDLNDGALVAGDPALNITGVVVQRLRGAQASAPSR